MFSCTRCGSSFNPLAAAATENCPRCRARDGVKAPLSFRLFTEAPRRTGPRPSGQAPTEPRATA